MQRRRDRSLSELSHGRKQRKNSNLEEREKWDTYYSPRRAHAKRVLSAHGVWQRTTSKFATLVSALNVIKANALISACPRRRMRSLNDGTHQAIYLKISTHPNDSEYNAPFTHSHSITLE